MGTSCVSATIDPSQVKALKAGIRAAGPAARRELRADLKSAGQIVQKTIQAMTPVNQTRYGAPAGLLRKSTKLKIATLAVTIYNDATNPKDGRFYGGYVEFKYGGKHAFFYPSWEVSKAGAMREFDKVLVAARDAYMK